VPNQLKLCPFCRGTPVRVFVGPPAVLFNPTTGTAVHTGPPRPPDSQELYVMKCSSCGAQTPGTTSTPCETAWNRRAPGV
jgi:hypothetical protein